MVANPARGQLNRENEYSPACPRACLRIKKKIVSRDGFFSRLVPRQPAHLHTQAESGAYLRDSSRVPRRRPIMKPPYAIGSVPCLSGDAIAYRWRSLPRVRRHRASKPQGSSERVLPWQITMDQLIFASLSHTQHYWYEVGMSKVPAVKPSEMPTKLESTPTHRVSLKVGAVFSRFISSRRWKPALSDGSCGGGILFGRETYEYRWQESCEAAGGTSAIPHVM